MHKTHAIKIASFIQCCTSCSYTAATYIVAVGYAAQHNSAQSRIPPCLTGAFSNRHQSDHSRQIKKKNTAKHNGIFIIIIRNSIIRFRNLSANLFYFIHNNHITIEPKIIYNFHTN
ncbi:hypothetical protein DERF_001510 [Dermatophagoides farinae]|uniref:Uncharacterized protein n=1 Tax=Dermatophagoides farinae TaxID=6954 RepID=A0A922LD07_DERFA|nr:hypothetical protein DERF_001510 [Dermatophagoides farinae]